MLDSSDLYVREHGAMNINDLWLTRKGLPLSTPWNRDWPRMSLASTNPTPAQLQRKAVGSAGCSFNKASNSPNHRCFPATGSFQQLELPGLDSFWEPFLGISFLSLEVRAIAQTLLWTRITLLWGWANMNGQYYKKYIISMVLSPWLFRSLGPQMSAFFNPICQVSSMLYLIK